MKVDYETLEARLHSERLKFFEIIKFHRKCEEKIDFVVNNNWLQKQKESHLSCSISTFWSRELTFSISNVPIEDFIENVLGPFHLKYNIKWEFSLEGDEADPVCVFSDEGKHFSPIKFRVKEGMFKVCKYKRRILKLSELINPEPIFEIVMECE